MLLCDHICFWQDHFKRPQIETVADEIYFVGQFTMAIMVHDLVRKMAVEYIGRIAEIYEKEGEAGLKRWAADMRNDGR